MKPVQFTHHRSRNRQTAADLARASLAVGGSTAAGLSTAMPATYPYLYSSPDAPAWALNQVKGGVGEELMERVVSEQFLRDTGNWVSCPPRSGPHGLDGLYMRVNSQGQVKPPLVVESKYGTAQLGSTQDGRQMSDAWVRPRMAGPAQTYRTLTWSKGDAVVRRSYVPEDVSAVRVPLSDTQTAAVWQDDAGRHHIHAPDKWGAAEVQRQVKQTADILSGASAGKIEYRTRLFRYRVVDGEHEILLESLQADGSVALHADGSAPQQIIRGSADELPDTVRKSLQRAFQTAFENEGNLPPSVARRLAKHCVKHPEHVEQLGLTRKDGRYVTVAKGVFTALGTAAVGGIMAGIMSGIQQSLRRGEIDWSEVASHAAVGAGSTALAYAGGAVIHYGLVSTEVGSQIAGMMPVQQIAGQSVERVLGTVGGAAVGSAAFVVGMHLTRSLSPRQSRRLIGRSMARVLAAKGATATAMSGAAALGTASTGTAISSLSGAAAQSATLAFWGGGSLASGGLGMAGGMVALTGVGAVAGVVAFATIGYTFKLMDDAEQSTTIEARLDLVEDRVSRGAQPEWA